MAEKRRSEILERKAMTREQLIQHAKTKVHPGWPEEEYEPWADAKSQLSPNVVSGFGGFSKYNSRAIAQQAWWTINRFDCRPG